MSKVNLQYSQSKASNYHFTHAKYYPWFVILLCASLLFYKYALSVSPSSMTDELMQVFHVSGAGLGNIGAAFYYTYTITQLFVGVLLDRYSARFFAAISVAVSALGALVFAHAHLLSVALVGRALMGFGAAFATVTFLKMATVWFRANQLAFVNGLLATAVMVGAVSGVAPLSSLVTTIGWRQSLWLVAMIGFVIAGLFLLCARDNPKDLTAKAKVAPHTFVQWHEILQVWHNPQNWLLTAVSGLAFVPLLIFGGLWGTPFLRSMYHVSPATSGWLVSVVFVGLGIGAPLFGLLSDRLQQRRKVMLLGVGLSLIMVSGVIYLPHLPYWLLETLLFLFGFGSGAFMLVFSLSRQVNPLKLAATAIAMINTGELLGAVTEPLIGKLLDLSHSDKLVNGVHYFSISSYQHAFSLLPGYLVLALVAICFIREPK